MTTSAFDAGRPAGTGLANWREAPQNRWSFRHVRELVPSARVRAPTTGGAEPDAPGGALDGLDVELPGGARGGLASLLSATRADELLVWKSGRAAYHWAAPDSDPAEPHLLFSVSKSITALLAGILEGQGLLDPEAPVTTYVPEMAASPAYGSASVRDVLDMAVSLDFEESYLDPDGAFARYRRAMLWNPCPPGATEGDLLTFLATLRRQDHAHGTRFHYASPNADLLGIIVERAGGAPYATLLQTLLWQPMGARDDASVTLDRRGAARAAGGVSATARDLARLGDLVRRGGGGIVPAAFVEDLWRGGSREAWLAAEDPVESMPEARYRSQWYAVGDENDCLCAIGIHGQWIFIDPTRETVIVRLASQALPLDDAIKLATVRSFHAIARAL
ncbi:MULTISPECIES: serine hydrolase domain-containing protein [unclassified Aureimonas]|uniref:serine hydrolase domain-containing protein n=1 Tax=unclassified Aureimonas TaxID=2615206 RepID=UPI000700F987|nr:MULTISPECIES: serine hydrolase [unclassified Aureimonas]KQT63971.1 hypothetical protein ASG62_02810 [Aureimonas sp. Leaf427]KQT81164.1 hypothetical protein ASG54_00080 [Aureimonas sp. Leaf460]